jgi:hypothetical protein
LSLAQYQFLAGRQASYNQAANRPITATEREWLQPHLGPVLIKAVGFADQPDGCVGTSLWALAELYPSREFALQFLSVRHQQQGDRASYYLWQLDLPPISPAGVASTLATVHPDERVTIEPGGEVATRRYRAPVPPEESG